MMSRSRSDHTNALAKEVLNTLNDYRGVVDSVCFD
jgi:hypothetical protein